MESSLISPTHEAFAKELIKQQVCWRCVLLLLQVGGVNDYRRHSFDDLEAQLEVHETGTCVVCLGLLQNAENTVADLISTVQNSGFEYSDFKISVTVPFRAHLSRYVVVSKAEQKLGAEFKGLDKK